MTDNQFIFGFLSILCFTIGILLLFLKTDKNEAIRVSKALPGASLYLYKWFKYFGAFFCFVIGIIAGIQAVIK